MSLPLWEPAGCEAGLTAPSPAGDQGVARFLLAVNDASPSPVAAEAGSHIGEVFA